ncbi:hypothetical protein ZIOFF_072248 [Zingiber officinale]|uniref:Uncharacterized protein n=1 Tax=Zingiber officinale TaxID=94328 RepID=A0A8J5CAQ1_ZINOF|nr:hypothetical protein ZIOFF_072248 [Zingiber officinale]
MGMRRTWTCQDLKSSLCKVQVRARFSTEASVEREGSSPGLVLESAVVLSRPLSHSVDAVVAGFPITLDVPTRISAG